MGNIKGRFADQDSYVLSALIQTARSNQADLNVTIQEQDYLQATAATQQQQGLAGTVVNPVPNVTLAAQQAVGSEQNIERRPPCFLGNTKVTLFDGTQIAFSRLFMQTQRLPVLSFDEEKRSNAPGEIKDVFKNVKHQYLHVSFDDDSATDVVPEHRYWTPEGWTCIKDLLYKYVYSDHGRRIQVVGMDEVMVPDGIFVYNLHIEKYLNYYANGHLVHNNKPAPTD